MIGIPTAAVASFSIGYFFDDIIEFIKELFKNK